MIGSKKHLLTTASALLVLAPGAAMAEAQATSQPENPSAAVADEEEIIVTATKRSERLLDVPQSITALSSETIEQRGFVDSEDYLRRIPGVSQIGEDGSQVIIMRGLGTEIAQQNFGSGPTTATYFGETPTTTSSGVVGGSANDIKLIDIDRVEVLRGPQGTAFGSSALGGAVRIIPSEPNLRVLEGKVSAEYSSTARFGGDNYQADAVLNVPLVADRLAVRAVAYKIEQSGYYRNVAASSAFYRMAVIEPFRAETFAFDQGRVGNQDVWGIRFSVLAAPTDDLRLSLNYINQETKIDGEGGTNFGENYEQGDVIVLPAGRFRDKAQGVSDSQTRILNAKAEYDFGWSDLIATYSHVKGGVQLNSGFYVLPSPWSARATHNGDMAEVRIATKFDGPINVLAGVYYEDLKDIHFGDFWWAADPDTNPFGGLLPCGSCIDPSVPFLDRDALLLGSRVDRRRLKQKAAFGEVTWEPTKQISFTAGARVYSYKRGFREFAEGIFYGSGINNDERQKISDRSFKLNASYKPNENTHLYAGWAQGFRLGRPNPTLPASCDVDPPDGLLDGLGLPLGGDVKSDTVDSYEAGGKFRLFNRRLHLDAAIFRVDWKDIPTSVSVPTCLLPTTINIGKARSEGLEVQLSFQATDALRVDASGSWTKARFLEAFAPGGIGKGDRLPGSPKYIANLGIEYTFKIGSHDAFIRGDASYIGGFYASAAQANAGIKSGDYTLLDLTAGIDFDNMELSLFIKNLTNDDSFTVRYFDLQPNELSQQLQPRTVGARLSYKF